MLLLWLLLLPLLLLLVFDIELKYLELMLLGSFFYSFGKMSILFAIIRCYFYLSLLLLFLSQINGLFCDIVNANKLLL